MRRLKSPVLVAVAVGALGFLDQRAVAEGPRWKAELGRDLVQKHQGKLKIEEFSLCTITPQWGGEGKRLQFRSYAEAPADLVSREILVRWFADYEARVASKFEEQGRLTCKTIGAPIGKVDLELTLLMTPEGLQWEMTDHQNGRQERVTRAWSEVYPD